MSDIWLPAHVTQRTPDGGLTTTIGGPDWTKEKLKDIAMQLAPNRKQKRALKYGPKYKQTNTSRPTTNRRNP